jgi:hypothetical protein
MRHQVYRPQAAAPIHPCSAEQPANSDEVEESDDSLDATRSLRLQSGDRSIEIDRPPCYTDPKST